MSIQIDHRDRVAIVTLDRPEKRNAFDDALIAALTEAYRRAAADDEIRAVLLRAGGPVFSAGADLGWMRRMADYSPEENLADARALAELMRVVDTCPKPTLARVHGSAFAGALGLLACSDIVIAVPEAEFAVTEVRIGLIPAVIGPYLVRAIGARQARRFVLTAERFSAAEAHRLGLVHEVVAVEMLEAAVERHLTAFRAAAPGALTAAKRLIAAVDRPLDNAVIEETARAIADIRAEPEGREGLAAFLERRKPSWQMS